MKYWILIWVTILINMGRYSGIVWVIIANCHHTQEVLLQLTHVIKKLPGSDWEKVRDFFTKKRGYRFGSLSFALFHIPFHHPDRASDIIIGRELIFHRDYSLNSFFDFFWST